MQQHDYACQSDFASSYVVSSSPYHAEVVEAHGK
jgi:hypothetical protein